MNWYVNSSFLDNFKYMSLKIIFFLWIDVWMLIFKIAMKNIIVIFFQHLPLLFTIFNIYIYTPDSDAFPQNLPDKDPTLGPCVNSFNLSLIPLLV